MSGPATRALGGIRSDPVGFCREVLKFSPWSKQRKILESVRDHRRTAVRSAHGVGKTRTAAAAVLWWLAAHPHSVAVTTAPTFVQVREQLWREIGAAYAPAAEFFGGELTDTRLELGPDWFGIGLSTDKPSNFQGYHSDHLLLVVDEAGGVSEEIFEAAEGYLSSAGSHVLMLGNPTALSGTFFRSFHSDRALYNTIAVSAFDTPAFTGEEVPPAVLRRLTSPEYVETAKARWSEVSPLYQIRVLGEFATVTDDTVVPFGELGRAQAREVEPSLPIVVACDVARFGSDETVIAVRYGNRVRVRTVVSQRDTMEVAGIVLRAAREAAHVGHGTPVLVVDDVGVGGGVVDRLKEIGEFRVVGFNAGAKPLDPLEYPNRRSEVWFTFAEELPEIDLDGDEQLAADLLAPKYSIDSKGRRVVEEKAKTKQRLGRSPDRADAVLLAWSGADDRGDTVVSVCYSCGSEACGGGLECASFGPHSKVVTARGDERFVGTRYIDEPGHGTTYTRI